MRRASAAPTAVLIHRLMDDDHSADRLYGIQRSAAAGVAQAWPGGAVSACKIFRGGSSGCVGSLVMCRTAAGLEQDDWLPLRPALRSNGAAFTSCQARRGLAGPDGAGRRRGVRRRSSLPDKGEQIRHRKTAVGSSSSPPVQPPFVGDSASSSRAINTI